MWTVTADNWNRTWAAGREGLVNSIPVHTPKYLLPSQWIPVLAPNYSLPVQSEYLLTLHQSVAPNLSDVWQSTSEIGAAQLRSVTEIAPKSPFLRVNRSPIRYGFHIGARAIDCGFPELPANRKRQEVTWPGPCRQVHVCTAGPHSRGKWFTLKFFAP